MMVNNDEMTNDEMVKAQDELWNVLEQNLSEKNLENVKQLMLYEYELAKREENYNA
jgi:hypothetical protein